MYKTMQLRLRKGSNMKKIFALLTLISLLALTACGVTSAPDGVFTDRAETTDTVTNFVQIELENGGIIQLELYPDTAPQTVANFQKLVSEHFYDGIIFHRVISGFMIQGGDPEGTGYGGSDETIFGEFAVNGFQNDLSHERGVVSMARKSVPYDSASSQFFIMHQDTYASSLDGAYAAFGRVIAGMETVDWIAAQPTNSSDKPLEDIVMKEVRFIEGK